MILSMNRYLAISHILSLLEAPIDAQAFAAAVASNPLFASACTTPQRFLALLHEEGLLTAEHYAAQGERFVLSGDGRLLQRQVLNWTARDKEAIQARTAEQRALTGEGPVDPRCPVCGSDFCALYLFVILSEKLWAGLVERAWPEGEPGLLAAVLAQLEAAPRFLIDETEPPDSLLPSGEQALARMLGAAADYAGPGICAAFEALEPRRLKLPAMAEAVMVPRLRFEQALLAPELLRRLRRLAYPGLYPGVQGGQADDSGCVVRISRPAILADRALILVRVAGSHGHQDRLWLLRRTGSDWAPEAYFDGQA